MFSFHLLYSFVRHQSNFRYKFVLRVVTQFFAPVLLMVILYGNVIKTIMKARQQRQKMSANQSALQEQRREHQIAIMLVIVVVIFTICFSILFISDAIDSVLVPYFELHEWEWLEEHNFNSTLYGATSWLSNVLVTFNSASTAIIYLIFSQKYRQVVQRLFSSSGSGGSAAPRRTVETAV